MATFQSIIQVRGVTKPIIVSKFEAEAVQKIMMDKMFAQDYVVKLNRYTFRKGDIKSVETNNDGSSVENSEEEHRKFYEEERRKRAEYGKLSARQKSEILDMFIYLYKFSVGELPSVETMESAKRIQLRFFTENPKRILCDLHILKSIIPMVPSKKISPWQSGYFRMIESAVFRDMQLANNK